MFGLGNAGSMGVTRDGWPPQPSLALSFVGASALDSRITFTRASTASYFNSSGVLTSAASGAPRFDYDPVTLAARGLLIEEQRTNLLLRSEEFDNASWTKNRATISANAVASPDGTQDADKLVEDTTAASNHQAYQSQTVTSGLTYAFSVFAKAAERTQIALNLSSGAGAFSAAAQVIVNLSNGSIVSGSGTVTSVGNGWYRISVTNTAILTAAADAIFRISVAGSTTYTGDGTSGIYIWGAQLEAGAFATSYIPTTSAQATRIADSATMTGANFSSWYNQSEGTVFEDLQLPQINASVAYRAWEIDDGTNTQRLRNNASGAWIYEYGSDGSFTFAILAAGVEKVATAYKANDAAASRNGSAVVTDTSVTMLGSFNRLTIGGSTITSGRQINGWIKRIAYYPRRLTNAELQGITT